MPIAKSIIRRYLVLSVVASIIPVVLIGLLYDRLAGGALDKMLGEQRITHLTATSNRLKAFLEARRYQVETLASYPGIAAPETLTDETLPSETQALLQIESDLPDLYGILLFDAAGRLQRVIPGQAASGGPYWQDHPFNALNLPRAVLGDTEILGPVAPSQGDAGWLLIRHALHGQHSETPIGHIALHVRLASLTEQLGTAGAAAVLNPVLRTPAGEFNTVGLPVLTRGDPVLGPEVLPGWRPVLDVETAGVLHAFQFERRLLLLSVLCSAVLIVWLFHRLSRELRHRVDVLVQGTEAVSAGQLDHRIADEGDDEIAAVSHAFNAMSAKLHDSIERAVRAEKLALLGQFATSIAHEIRNPLSSLKITVQALSRREADPRRHQLLINVEGEVDRLARSVTELLEFGRPRTPCIEPVPVGEVLKRVAETLEAEAAQRGVKFSLQGDAALVLLVDRDQLLQIILNLALNAVQAMDAPGSVVLRAFADGDEVVIEVTDTGCGIPPELLARVGAPFFTTKSQGLGLGLSISRQLCELNGGQLNIVSTPARGTTVHMVLPRETAVDE